LVAPRLILDEDRVVGFVMGNFDPDNEISLPGRYLAAEHRGR
jgi:hypothetical protein